MLEGTPKKRSLSTTALTYFEEDAQKPVQHIELLLIKCLVYFYAKSIFETLRVNNICYHDFKDVVL